MLLKRLNRLHIKQKLILIITASTLSGLLLMIVGLTTYQQTAYRDQMQREIRILAEVISDRSNAAILFGDTELLTENLTSMRLHQAIILACIYDEHGEVIASSAPRYRPATCPKHTAANGFYDNALHWTQPIVVDGEVMGRLYVKSHLQLLQEEYNRYLFIGLSITALAVLGSFIVALFVQRLISSPILNLAHTAKAIANNEGDNIRASKTTDDEIGEMVDAFNLMLDVIQSRERELKEHQDNLEKTVDERTRKLKIANQELEAFSYSVSHDLKAPLRALDGFSQAIIEDYGDQLDPLGQNYLNRIRSASQRMEKLIESMLYLSRIGRQNINIKEVNISHISYKVLSLLHEGDPNRDIHTEVEPDIIVDADQALIEIVLNNLIGNAWKYTLKTEKPEIEIRKEQDYFYVRDNGAGFDMTYANKLFGAFQRLHKDQEFEGTGIGLATVARIVHRHGGEIWATAEPDKGATFYVRLPKQ